MGGPKFPQGETQLAHNVVLMFKQRYLDVMDVRWTLKQGCVPAGKGGLDLFLSGLHHLCFILLFRMMPSVAK